MPTTLRETLIPLRKPWPEKLQTSSIYLELLSFAHSEPHYSPSSLSHEARRCHLLANKTYGWAAYIFFDVSPLPPQSLLRTAAESAALHDER